MVLVPRTLSQGLCHQPLIVLFGLFRPGSGASVSQPSTHARATALTEGHLLEAVRLKEDDPTSTAARTESRGKPLLSPDTAVTVASVALVLCSCSAVAMMFRGSRDHHGGSHNTHHSSGHHRSVPPQHLGKVPPSYDPRFEHKYSFRQYMKDMQHWVLYTDLQPHQQAVAILHNLDGAAHDLISQLSPAELYAGATVNGSQLDPVSHILLLLHQRFAQQDLVTRMSAMSEMLNFRRLHNEAIGSTLTRFEVARGRAASEGQFVMNIEGYSVMLMKECRLSRQHIHNLLLPYGGEFPKTEDEFQMLVEGIKNIGLILLLADLMIAIVLSSSVFISYFASSFLHPPKKRENTRVEIISLTALFFIKYPFY